MANLFRANLGTLGPALAQLNAAGVTEEMWALMSMDDGVYAHVVHDALLTKMNGDSTSQSEAGAIVFPQDGPPYRTKPRNGNGETRTGEYVVPVSYQLPPFAELDGKLFDWASDLFSDKYTWKEHRSVWGLVDRTPGERNLLVKQFMEEEIEEMGGLTSENVIAWAAAHGYRVATHEEAVDFAKAQPDLQRQFPIAALGSFAVDGDFRCVAVLIRDGALRDLDYGRFVSRWLAHFRFLLVRK